MRTYKDFEDYLQEKHAEQYTGLDDEMPDDYETWLADLDVNDLIKYGNQYGKICYEKGFNAGFGQNDYANKVKHA